MIMSQNLEPLTLILLILDLLGVFVLGYLAGCRDMRKKGEDHRDEIAYRDHVIREHQQENPKEEGRE